MSPARASALRPILVASVLSACAACHCPGVPPQADAGMDGGAADAGGTDAGGTDSGLPDDGGDGGTGGGGDGGRPGGGDAGTPDAGPCPPPYHGVGSTLASYLNVPRRLAVDALYVYFTEPGRPFQSTGRLGRLSRIGGAIETLASELSSPDAVAVDATAVYVLDDIGVHRVEKATGEITLLDPVQNNVLLGLTEIRLTATEVVVATGRNSLTRVNKDGTGHVDLYTGPAGASVQGLVLDQDQAYFLVSGVPEAGLYRVPIDGTAAAVRLRPEPAQGHSLLLTVTDFVWSEGSGGTGRLRKAPRGGGPASDLASNLAEPSRLTLVGNTLYFKDASLGGPGFFRYLPSCLPGTSAPVGPTGDGPGDLAFSDGALFFSSQSSSPNGYIGRLP